MENIIGGLKHAQEYRYSISIQKKGDNHSIIVGAGLFCFTDFALVVFEDEEDQMPIIYPLKDFSSIVVGSIYKAK